MVDAQPQNPTLRGITAQVSLYLYQLCIRSWEVFNIAGGSTIWEFLFVNPRLGLAWQLIWLLLTVSGLPGAGYIFSMSLMILAIKSFKDDFARTLNSHVVQPIQDSVVTVKDSLISCTAETVRATGTQVAEAIASVNSVLVEEGVTIKSLANNINRHKIGFSTSLYSLTQSRDTQEFGRHLLTAFSFMGLETSVMNSLVGGISERLTVWGHAHADDTEYFPESTGIDLKRIAALAGLGVAVTGHSISNSSLLEPLHKAQRETESLTKVINEIEGLLNDAGLIETGKYKYINTVSLKAAKLAERMNVHNQRLATQPAHYCRPDILREWKTFCTDVRNFNNELLRCQVASLRQTAVFTNVQLMAHKALEWDAKIANIVACNGCRPVPCGVCIVGASHLGKTTLFKQLSRNVCDKLRQVSSTDPSLSALQDADQWRIWSVQTRDEYDQGYGGQEITYSDDAFSDQEHKDHPMWLTFVSDQVIGTVQASLAEKGMPYTSRLVVTSCNNLPTVSVSINNVKALHNRFPICLGVRLKANAQRKEASDPYDPTFSHLDYHFSTMTDSCLHHENCGWWDGGVSTGSCRCTDTTLDEVTNMIVTRIVDAERKFQGQIAALGYFQMDSDDDQTSISSDECDLSDAEAEEYSEDDRLSTIVEDDGSESEESTPSTQPPAGREFTRTTIGKRWAGDTLDEERRAVLYQRLRDQGIARVNARRQPNIPVVEEPPVQEEVVPPPPLQNQVVIPDDDNRLHDLEIQSGVPTAAPTVNIENNLHNLVRQSYTSPPIILVSDNRVRCWAQYLELPDGRSFDQWCADTNTSSAYQALNCIGMFKTKNANYESFINNFCVVFQTPRRIVDQLTDTQYFVSWEVSRCREMIPVPYYEGSVDDFAQLPEDVREEITSWLDRILENGNTADQARETATLVGPWMRRFGIRVRMLEWANIGIVSGSVAVCIGIVGTAFSTTIEVGEMGIVAGTFVALYSRAVGMYWYNQLALGRFAYPEMPSPLPMRLAYQVALNNLTARNVWTLVKESAVYILEASCTVIVDCAMYLMRLAEKLGDIVSKALYWLFDLVGLGEVQWLNSLSEYVSEISSASAWLAISVAISGIVWALGSWLYRWWRGEASSTQVQERLSVEGSSIPPELYQEFQTWLVTNIRTPLNEFFTLHNLQQHAYNGVRSKKSKKTSSSYKKTVKSRFQVEMKSHGMTDEEIFNSSLADATEFGICKLEKDGVIDVTHPALKIRYPVNDFWLVPYLQEQTNFGESEAGIPLGCHLLVNKLHVEDQPLSDRHSFKRLWQGILTSKSILRWEDIFFEFDLNLEGDASHEYCNLSRTNTKSDLFSQMISGLDSVDKAKINTTFTLNCEDGIIFCLRYSAPLEGAEQSLFKLLNPLFSNEKLIVQDHSMYGCITTVDGKEIVFGGVWIVTALQGRGPFAIPKPIQSEHVKVLRSILGVEEKRLVVSPPSPPIAETQGMDDTSTILLNCLRDDYLVWVKRFKPDQMATIIKSGKYRDMSLCGGLQCGGIGYYKFILVPGHLCKRGELIMWSRLGRNSLDSVSKDPSKEWCAAMCQYSDPATDTAICTIMTRDEAQIVFGLTTKEMRASNYVYTTFPSGIEKWFVNEGEIVPFTTSLPIIQYVPKSDLVVTGQVTLQPNYTLSVDGERRTITLLSVTGYNNFSILKEGDCGGPMLAYCTRMPRKLLGFHVIGNDTWAASALITSEHVKFLVGKCGYPVQLSAYYQADDDKFEILDSSPRIKRELAGVGYLSVKNWPKTVWSEEDMFTPFVQGSDDSDLPKGSQVEFVGSLPFSHSASPVRVDNKWEKSPFYDAFPIEMEPSCMSADDKRITADLPLNKNGKPSLLLTPNSVFGRSLPEPNCKLLEEVTNQIADYFKMHFMNLPIGCPTDDLDVLLHIGMNGATGYQYMTGMNVNRSAGLPWISNNDCLSKKDMIDVDNQGVRKFNNSPAGQMLRERCKEKLAKANLGQRSISFCASKLKDTLVSLEHCAIGKTRVFNCDAAEAVLMMDALFAPFKEHWLRKQTDMFHVIGIDPISKDWDRVFRYLSVFDNVLDIDYKNFDKHLHEIFMRAAMWIMIKTIAKCSPDDWETARFCIADEIINSLCVDERTVYMTAHGNKSGSAFTTIINNIVNLLMIVYCISKILGVADFALILEHVRFLFWGDDVIMTVSDELKDVINYGFLIEELTNLGQEATPADKREVFELFNFTTWSNATFLKRGFRSEHGFMVAPLKQRSIKACFGWSQVPADKVSEWSTIVISHLEEAALHGEEFYEHFRGRLMSCINGRRMTDALRQRIIPYLSLGFENIWDRLSPRFSGIEFQAEDPTIPQMIRRENTDFYTWLEEQNYGALLSQVNAILGRLDTIETDYSNLRHSVDALQTNYTGLENQISSLSSEIRNLELRITNDIATQNTAIAQLQDQLTTVSGTVAGHTAQIARMEQEEIRLNTVIGDAHNRLDIQGADLTSLRATFTSSLATQNTNISRINVQLGEINSSQVTLEGLISALSIRIDNLSSSTVSAATVNQITEHVKALEAYARHYIISTHDVSLLYSNCGPAVYPGFEGAPSVNSPSGRFDPQYSVDGIFYTPYIRQTKAGSLASLNGQLFSMAGYGDGNRWHLLANQDAYRTGGAGNYIPALGIEQLERIVVQSVSVTIENFQPQAWERR